jgi:hypothetical protein
MPRRTPRTKFIDNDERSHSRGVRDCGEIRGIETWQKARCAFTESGFCRSRCEAKCICGPPMCKGPGHRSAEARIEIDLVGAEIDHLNARKRERAQAARGWRV